jgi:hypothetical protein
VSGGAPAKSPRAPDASSRPNRPQSGVATVMMVAGDSSALRRAGRRVRRDRVVGGFVADLRTRARGQSRAAPAQAWQGLAARHRDCGATRTTAIVHRGDHRVRPRRSRCRQSDHELPVGSTGESNRGPLARFSAGWGASRDGSRCPGGNGCRAERPGCRLRGRLLNPGSVDARLSLLSSQSIKSP